MEKARKFVSKLKLQANKKIICAKANAMIRSIYKLQSKVKIGIADIKNDALQAAIRE